MPASWWIAGGRIVDPATGRDEIGDLFLAGGRITGKPAPGSAFSRLDAAGCVVAPGLTDIHTHLREPGDESLETVASGTAAAARGGFTTVVAMPNTRPPADTPERIRDLLVRAGSAGLVGVLPCACLTEGRRGLAPTDPGALKAAGAAAFSDDGTTPLDEALFMRIAAEIHALELPILDHAEDTRCSVGGVMHAGERSRRLGLPGIPEEAELLAVERDVRAASETGCRIHVQHVSSARSIECIRRARERGLPVSAEATPHHLAFCDDDVVADNANFKMNPPLRGERDRRALREAVADGVISALATDHAPHSAASKARGFIDAPFGVTGLETALAVTYTLLVARGGMTHVNWLRRWTTGPARILGCPPPRLSAGEPANIVVFNPAAVVKVDASEFASRSANSPFIGRAFNGRVIATFHRGAAVWLDREARIAGDVASGYC